VIEARINPDSTIVAPCEILIGKTHRIPVSGNTWVLNPKTASVRRSGLVNWKSSDEVVTTYFRTSIKTTKVDIELIGEIDGTSEILVEFAGQKKSFTIGGDSPISLG